MIKEIALIIGELSSVYNTEDYEMVVNHYENDIERFTSKELLLDLYDDIERIETTPLTLAESINYLTSALKEFEIDWNSHIATLHDVVIEYEIATEEELQVAYYFNGYNIDAINHLIYKNKGCHDILQLNNEYDLRIDFKNLGIY